MTARDVRHPSLEPTPTRSTSGLVRVLGPLSVIVALVATPLLPALAADFTITITDVVTPATATVTPGTTIVFRNDDGEDHRMATSSGPGEFDTGNIGPGESASVTLSVEGTYTYFDDRNDDVAGYQGTIVVSADGGGGTTPTTTPPASGDVSMAGRLFSPSSISIVEGGTVSFANNDDEEHTVTANDGTFDSGVMASGASYNRTFATAGTYPYFCEIHPDMTGTVLVSGAGGEPPPPPAPTTTTTAPPGGAVDGDVEIFDYGYRPVSLQVTVGATVTFANTGSAMHTVTDRAGRFDSGFVSGGSSYSRTFTAAGTYEYFCTLHPEMAGTLTVSSGSGSPPPPPPPTTTTTGPGGGPGASAGDVSVFDYGYSPATLDVTVGATITFTNDGAAMHTVTDRAGRFDSGFISGGSSYSRTFTEAGTFEYYCTLHPQMSATLRVSEPGGEPPPPAPPAADPPVAVARSGEVSMRDFSFSPGTVTVGAGGSVTWVNTGQAVHTVTARNGSFDSGMKNPGSRYTRTFDTPGTFSYWCVLHPQMTGTVVVTDASGMAPAEEELPVSTTLASTAALGGADTGGPVSVDVIDLDYSPRRVEVVQGNEVIWTNIGQAPHTVTAKDNSWTSATMETGGVFSRVFDQVGTFEYFCTLHPTMVGKVVVTPAPGETIASVETGPLAAGELEGAAAAGSGAGPAIITTVGALMLMGMIACVIVIRSELRQA